MENGKADLTVTMTILILITSKNQQSNAVYRSIDCLQWPDKVSLKPSWAAIPEFSVLKMAVGQFQIAFFCFKGLSQHYEHEQTQEHASLRLLKCTAQKHLL